MPCRASRVDFPTPRECFLFYFFACRALETRKSNNTKTWFFKFRGRWNCFFSFLYIALSQRSGSTHRYNEHLYYILLFIIYFIYYLWFRRTAAGENSTRLCDIVTLRSNTSVTCSDVHAGRTNTHIHTRTCRL